MVGYSKNAKFDSKFVIVSSVLLIVLLACFVLADMSSTMNSGSATTIYSNTLAKTLTFNVTAGAAPSYYIKQINFTLAAGLNYTSATNATSSLGVFSNASATNLSFLYSDGMIASGASQTFVFTAVALSDGAKTVNLTTFDSLGRTNYTVYTVVFDATKPTAPVNLTAFNRTINRTLVSSNFSVFDAVSLNYTNTTIYNAASVIVNTTTTTTPVAANTSLTVSSDGNYTINATAYDTAGNQNSFTINITVDTTAPVVTYAGGLYYATSPANITLNATILEATSSVSSVYFNVSNSSGTQFNYSTPATKSGNTWSFVILNTNTTSYPDGAYTIRVIANDTMNNVNNLVTSTLYVDRTAPSSVVTGETTTEQTVINFTITMTDATSGISSGCIVNRSDGSNATVSGTGVNQSAYENGLTCNTAYSYTLTCNDSAGNINNTGTYSVTTSACDEESTGSSGGSSLSVTTNSLATGITENLLIGTVMNFNLGTIHHTLMVTSIRDSKATIRVSSEPQYATLAAGEEKKFDLTNDSIYDLLVKVNSITANRADVTVKSISEAMTATTTPTAPAEEKTPVTQKVAEAVKSVSSKTYWWIVAVVVIIAIVLYLVFRRKN